MQASLNLQLSPMELTTFTAPRFSEIKKRHIKLSVPVIVHIYTESSDTW